jgi:hypothetical protein
MSVSVLNLDIGTARRSIQYRKGSLDEFAIVQALKSGSYGFGNLRRGAELSAHYEKLNERGETPLIVDAGAGIGASTIYFHHAFPKARIVATEPDRGSFQLLSANVRDMPVDCVQTVPAGEKKPAAGDREAARVTAAELLNRPGTAPFIVKLDIEASAEDLFTANTEWIARVPVIIVALRDILIPGSDKVRRFVACIGGHERDFAYTQDNIFSIRREPH